MSTYVSKEKVNLVIDFHFFGPLGKLLPGGQGSNWSSGRILANGSRPHTYPPPQSEHLQPIDIRHILSSEAQEIPYKVKNKILTCKLNRQICQRKWRVDGKITILKY